MSHHDMEDLMNAYHAPRAGLLRSVGVALAAVLGLPSVGVAQIPTVILQIEQETTSRNVQAQETAEWAAANGIDTGMLSMIFGQMTDAIGVGLAAAPGELAAALPADIMTKLQLGGQLAAYEIGSELRDARTPDHDSSSATIYITPDLFMMIQGEQAIVWMPAPADASGSARMWFGNRSTGQFTPVDLNHINTFIGDEAQHSGIDPTALVGGPRTIAGHSARGYRYNYTMDLAMGVFPGAEAATGMMGPPGDAPASAQNVVEGEAWIARDLPEALQVRSFFQEFAGSFDGGMMGGQVGVMADLAALGVPLETKETLRTYLLSQVPGSDERQLMMESVSTMTVTDITMTTLTEEELFGPGGLSVEGTTGSAEAGLVEQPCDCSCTAFEELQELDENDPDAMARAMCAQKCMAKWVACVTP